MPQTTRKKTGKRQERSVTENLMRTVDRAPSWLFIMLGVVAVIAISYAAGWNDEIEDIIEDDTREGYSTEIEEEDDLDEAEMTAYEEGDEEDDEAGDEEEDEDEDED